jgi:ABC-2 type transport system permease protein
VGSAPPLYARLALASVRAYLRNPLMLAVRAAATVLAVLGEAFAVVVLLDRFGTLGGWSTGDVLVLIGIAYTGLGVALTLGDALDPIVFSALVRTGRFDQVLTRPTSPLLWVMTSDVQVRHVGRVVAGVAVLVAGAAVADVVWSARTVALAVLAVAADSVVCLAVLVLGAAVTFRTVEGSEFVNAFTYGGATLVSYPLQIYASALRFVFLWVVPLGLAVYVPALHLLGRAGPPGVARGLLWLVPLAAGAFAGVAAVVWRRGVRHYQGAGS